VQNTKGCISFLLFKECGTPGGTENEDAEYGSNASTPQSKDKKKRPRRDRDSGVKLPSLLAKFTLPLL